MSANEENLSNERMGWFKWRLPGKAWRRKSAEPTASQKQEMAALVAGYNEFKQALVDDTKARNYLTQRAIPLEVAQMIGGAYVPWDRRKEPGLGAFADHIIFPCIPSGFIGRTLYGWEPGMSEAQHRQKLMDKKIAPYQRTYTIGIMPAQPGRMCVMVEGVFDGLALLAAGLDVQRVLITNTFFFPVEDLPEQVKITVIAMDGDKVGKKAAEFQAEQFNKAGIQTIICTPPDDGIGKDWNERWQKAREAGLKSVLDAYQAALILERAHDTNI